METVYTRLSDVDIVALAIWREARGEGDLGRRGVGWVIQNRVDHPGWWGHTYHGVVLCPYQFSSFNESDPQHSLYPDDDSHTWLDCQQIAQSIISGTDTDITSGATHYHDISMGWPTAWGNQGDYAHTLDVGRLKFYRQLNLKEAQ